MPHYSSTYLWIASRASVERLSLRDTAITGLSSRRGWVQQKNSVPVPVDCQKQTVGNKNTTRGPVCTHIHTARASVHTHEAHASPHTHAARAHTQHTHTHTHTHTHSVLSTSRSIGLERSECVLEHCTMLSIPQLNSTKCTQHAAPLHFHGQTRLTTKRPA